MLLPDKEYLFLRSKVVELSRIELLTSCVQGRRSPSWAIAPHMLVLLFVIRLHFNLSDKIKKKWWVWVDLNHRPHPYQGCALTNWATDPYYQYNWFWVIGPFLYLHFYQTTCVNTHTFLKEVIQPHLPVGLPCYDFTPVMNHTVVTVLTKLD